MASAFHLMFLLATFAGWANRQQAQVIDYLLDFALTLTLSEAARAPSPWPVVTKRGPTSFARLGLGSRVVPQSRRAPGQRHVTAG